jgi:16S rRNA (cytidine1402-2'-O)-methyltransferase
MSGILYVVGTPIGNLGDFSPRAVETLEKCDFIAAEDTRVTLKLLNHFGIKKQMISYHEHNRFSQGEPIVERLLNGESCALVTDAGMPAISDPGEDLVRLCHERGIKVEAVPGPTAFATAVALSGMPSGRFTFEGFLSVNKMSRRQHLESLKDERRTMVFYEAPHKLSRTLCDMADVFGDREIAIIKELTKIHETVERTTLFRARDKHSEVSPKGEYVLVLGGKAEDEHSNISLSEAVNMAKELKQSGMSATQAAKEVARQTGLKKGEIYKELISDE